MATASRLVSPKRLVVQLSDYSPFNSIPMKWILLEFLCLEIPHWKFVVCFTCHHAETPQDLDPQEFGGNVTWKEPADATRVQDQGIDLE